MSKLTDEAERRFPGDQWSQALWMTLVARSVNRDDAQVAMEEFGYDAFGRLIDEIERMATQHDTP